MHLEETSLQLHRRTLRNLQQCETRNGVVVLVIVPLFREHSARPDAIDRWDSSNHMEAHGCTHAGLLQNQATTDQACENPDGSSR